jgi:hypothetical protein
MHDLAGALLLAKNLNRDLAQSLPTQFILRGIERQLGSPTQHFIHLAQKPFSLEQILIYLSGQPVQALRLTPQIVESYLD